MKIRTIQQTIDMEHGRIAVRVPRPGLGLFGRTAVVSRGWLDAVRYRSVEDGNATHYLHALAGLCRRGERDVLKAVDAGMRPLHVALAEAEAAAALGAPARIEVPTVDQLETISGDGRRDWAARVREARAANAAARGADQSRQAAERESVRLAAEIKAIEEEAEDARDAWRDAHDVRAAVFTRPPPVSFGRRPASVPTVPAYEAIGKGRPTAPTP